MNTNAHYLVTGTSSGIGKTISSRLLEYGCRVTGISRRISDDLLDKQPNYKHIELDLSDLTSLEQKLPQLAKQLQNIDGIIACAGSGRFASLEEFSYQQINELISLNLTSQIFLIRSLLPLLKKQGHGDIILLGSEAALRGSKLGTVYCASKFGLRGFSQALRQECASSDIRVTLINPGMVDTPFFEELSFQPGPEKQHAITSDDIADTVATILKMRPGTVIDEINLSPQTKVIDFKKH